MDLLGNDDIVAGDGQISTDLDRLTCEALVIAMREVGVIFEDGLSEAEIRAAEAYCDIVFPADLRKFLQTALPVKYGFEYFTPWRRIDPSVALGEEDDRDREGGPVLKQNLQEYFHEGFLDDVEFNNCWNQSWPPKPQDLSNALSLAKEILADEERVPKLIPIYSHRCMASLPASAGAGQPVLSLHGTDIIVYGNDLASYFAEEFGFDPVRPKVNYDEWRITIPFWMDYL
jgi:hypothetical protein